MDIDRISEMESCLKECTEATAGLCGQLDRMEECAEQMTRLFSYYGSEAWWGAVGGPGIRPDHSRAGSSHTDA